MCGMQRAGCMGTFALDALQIHLPLLKAPVALVMAVQGLGGAFRGCATGDEGFGSGEAKVSDDFPSRLRFMFGGEASASPL